MKFFLICVTGFVCIAGIVGCSGDNKPPLSSDQEQQANDLESIGTRSGGDWNKLTPAEQQKMIQIGGSEKGAKMLLLAKSGKLGRHEGSPPPGGPPTGGPSR